MSEEVDMEEQENLEKWRVWFLEEQESFEEDGMEVYPLEWMNGGMKRSGRICS